MQRKNLNEKDTKEVFIMLNKLYNKTLNYGVQATGREYNNLEDLRKDIAKIQEKINLWDL